MAYVIYETKTANSRKVYYWDGSKFVSHIQWAKTYPTYSPAFKAKNQLVSKGFDAVIKEVQA